MSIKLQILLRTIAVALSVVTGEYLPAMIALLAPMADQWSYSLGVVKAAAKKKTKKEDEDEDDEDDDKKKKSEKDDDE